MDTYQEPPADEMPEPPALDAMEEEAPAAAPVAEELTASEKTNLASFMSPELQKSIAGKCITRYERDLSSRADRMKRLKDLQKMYSLVAEQKNFPFQKAANVKTPALTGPNLQIQARLYDMVWPASGRIFNVIPATASDQAFAHLSEQFANSYVRYRMPYMGTGMDDTLHQMCLYGSAFRRTYWDTYEGKVRSDWIPIEDFVVAYSQRSQDPSMSDVERYTMIHRMGLLEIEAYGDEGIYINTDLVKGTGDRDTQSEFKDLADRIDGVSPDEEDDEAPRQVLEQHCIWRLPNQPTKHPAFDGKKHHLVITIDAVSEQILRISLREEDDPDDKRRHDRQLEAFQRYESDMRTFEAAMAAYQQQAMMTAALGTQTIAGPPGIEVQGMGAPPPQQMPPPSPPEPAPEPRPIRKRQICFFTHYRCFPSDGFYGLGYGDLLYGLTLAMNTLINQHIDGVTLKNAKPMFMSRNVRMQRGSVNVQPGEVVEIDGPMNDIRNAIMFLDPPDNDSSTMSLVKMLDGMKDTMVGSSDLMSGQAPGSNQTKVGMQILSDNMMAPISVLGRRVREAFRHELEKMWRCWSVFLEDEDVADIISETGQPQQIPIGKAMFTPNARLVPASDSRMKSQRIEDHKELFGYVMNNPFISQNPQIGPAVMAKLTEEGFRIFPDGEKLIPLLQPQQPQGPPPPKPQYEENAGFLRGEDSPVHPEDDDDQHLQESLAFLQSPDAQMMDKQGRQMAEHHARAHAAQRLSKKGAAFAQRQQEILGPGPGGSPPMAGPPGLPPPGGAPGVGA